MCAIQKMQENGLGSSNVVKICEEENKVKLGEAVRKCVRKRREKEQRCVGGKHQAENLITRISNSSYKKRPDSPRTFC